MATEPHIDGPSPVVEALLDKVKQIATLEAALLLAYPILHYYGHPVGEQHVNAPPSRRATEAALAAVRAALERKDQP